MAKNCRAERSIGFDSRSLVQDTYYITDEFDFDLSQWSRGNKFLSLALSYFSFFVVCLFASQVHAYVDGGVLPPRSRRQFNPVELLVYHLLSIRLFVWTYGADVRTRDLTTGLGEPNCCTDCTQVNIACICNKSQGKNNYAKVSKAATAIFSMGDMIEYTPNSCNDLFFWPIDLQSQNGKRYQPKYPTPNSNSPLRIVHAPNHREFKGTRYLEEAINSLQAEGIAIDLVMVERLSNEEALEIYKSADVIFDQCLIGFHGYFALEAMALGKPVMCFIRKPNEYLLYPDECPMINTHVTTLKDDLRRLVTHQDELNEIGQRGRNYIEKYFSFQAFSTRLKQTYQELGVIK